MKKEDVIEKKENPAVISYIQLLQNNISRMSSHSGIIKASTGVIFTIFTTILLSVEELKNNWWVAIPITMCLAFIDAYYLAIETAYRDKYDAFVDKLNNNIIDSIEIYNMKPRTTSLKCELLARTITSMKSFSIIGYYGLFIALSLIIFFK